MARMGMTLSVSFVVLSREKDLEVGQMLPPPLPICWDQQQHETFRQYSYSEPPILLFCTGCSCSLEELIVAKLPDFLLVAFVCVVYSICLYDVINVCLMEKCSWYKSTWCHIWSEIYTWKVGINVSPRSEKRRSTWNKTTTQTRNT